MPYCKIEHRSHLELIKIHPIPHPHRTAMGCFLWLQVCLWKFTMFSCRATLQNESNSRPNATYLSSSQAHPHKIKCNIFIQLTSSSTQNQMQHIYPAHKLIHTKSNATYLSSTQNSSSQNQIQHIYPAHILIPRLVTSSSEEPASHRCQNTEKINIEQLTHWPLGNAGILINV